MKKYLFFISLLLCGCKSNYDYGKEELDKKNYAKAESFFSQVDGTDSEHELAIKQINNIHSYYDSITVSDITYKISEGDYQVAYSVALQEPSNPANEHEFLLVRQNVQSLLVEQLIKLQAWQKAFEIISAHNFNPQRNQKPFEIIRKNYLKELDAAGDWAMILILFKNDVNKLPLFDATIVNKAILREAAVAEEATIREAALAEEAALHKPIYSLPSKYEGRFHGNCLGLSNAIPGISFVIDILGEGRIIVKESSERSDYESYECSYRLRDQSSLASGTIVADCGQNEIILRYSLTGNKVEWFIVGYCSGGDVKLHDVNDLWGL